MKIQQHIPGRTDVQCRERWMNVLSPEIKGGHWNPEEDQRLKEVLNRLGSPIRWSLVARELAPRTDSQCRRRWKVLCAQRERLAARL